MARLPGSRTLRAAVMTHVATFDRRQTMQTTAQPPRDDDTIDATVTIRRPVEDVFAFYRDFRNLPQFLGDVVAVEPIDPTRSRWTIVGPLGIRAHWTTTVTEERPNALIRYSVAGTGSSWEIHFAPGVLPGSTDVREVMRTPFGKVGRGALALFGKFPAKEVPANLHRLKQLMETGRVTDTSYAVVGKFVAP
jgi:uncharacterized membrane protein